MDSFSIGLRMASGPMNMAMGQGVLNPCVFTACQSVLQSWMGCQGNMMMPGYMQAPPMYFPMMPNMGQFQMPQPGWGSPFPFSNPFQAFQPMPYQPPGGQAYGPYHNSVPNYGTSYRYPEYGQMQQRARENGTLDGTPVTPHSSFHEDQFHTQALSRLQQRAAGRVMEEAQYATPREFTTLQRHEGQLQDFLHQQHELGHQFSRPEIDRMRAQGIEALYQDGKVGQGIGQANREHLELLEAWERSEANHQLKYGNPHGEPMSERAYQESPFNPHRQAAAEPAAEKPRQKPGLSTQQLQDVRRWEPPAQANKPAATQARPATTQAKPATTSKPEVAARPTNGTAQQKPASNQEAKPKPYDPNKDANALYKAMHGGFTGIGTDEAALFKALEGKSPEQIDALRANYKDHYGRELDTDIRGELSGKDLQRAQSLLKGNQTAASATALRQAIEGIGTDEKAVFEVLQGKSAEERKALQTEYQRQTGRTLQSDIKGDFSGAERDRANALLAGDTAGADAATLQKAVKGVGTDEAAIMQTLEGKSAEERAAIEASFKERYGVDLKTRLKGDLGGAELDRANALLDGNTAKATAAQIRDAAAGLGTDEKGIHTALEGKTAEERQAIAEAYQQTYGKDLNTVLSDEMSGNDLQKAQALLERGKLSEAEQLKFAMEGLGTDEEAVRAALQGKSKDDIARIRGEYESLTNRSLEGDLSSDLSGRDLFTANQDLKGRAETVDEAVQRANEVHQYERGGEGNSVSRGVMDFFSDKGELLDTNTQRINDSKARFDQLVAQGDLQGAEAEKQRMRELTGFQTSDVEVYREAKDSAADTAGTVAATAAGVAVVVATAGTATPLVATGLMAAGAGAGARVIASGAIQGEGYGWEGALSDAGRGAIDGGTSIIGMGSGRAATSAGKALAQEAAEQTVGRRILQAGAQGARDGLVGGAVGAGASEAIADGTWDDGFVDGLGKVATTTAIGAGTGVVAGGVVGGGMVAGKEAAEGLAQVTNDASARLSTAGREMTQTLRTAADDAGARLTTAGREMGESLRTASDGALNQIKIAGQEASERIRTAADEFRARRVTSQAPEVKVDTPEVKVNTPEVKVDTPEIKVNTPEVKVDTPEIKVSTPEVKVDTPEVKVDTPEVKVDIPENTPEVRVDGDLPEFDSNGVRKISDPNGGPEWTEYKSADGTLRTRTIEADDGGPAWTELDRGDGLKRIREVDAGDGGPPWNEIQTNGETSRSRMISADDGGPDWYVSQGKLGQLRTRSIEAADGGPAWLETDRGWGLERTRAIEASDGGNPWTEFQTDGVTTRSRFKAADDGGPEWYESVRDGKTTLTRNVPANDGKPDWYEVKSDTGNYKTRSFEKDGSRWSETIDGENWSVARDAAEIRSEAKKLGSHKVVVAGPDGPLDINIYGPADAQQLKRLEASLNDLPPGARRFGNEIYLSENLGEVFDLSGNSLGKTAGLGGNGAVTLNIDSIKDPKALRHVLYHEMGHNADRANGTLSANSKIWGGKSVSAYGGTNAAEDFAEVHGTVLDSWKRYSRMSPSDWASESFAAKKMEIVSMYGGSVPSADDLARAQVPAWKRWLGLGPSGPSSSSFDSWFSSSNPNSISRSLGFGDGAIDTKTLGDAAKKYLFGMTEV